MTTEEDRLKGDTMAGVDRYYAHKGKKRNYYICWNYKNEIPVTERETLED